jgi:hypothetical protein
VSLKLVVVRTTCWREGVLLGRPRVLPDRSRVYARIDALPRFGMHGLLESENLDSLWFGLFSAGVD